MATKLEISVEQLKELAREQFTAVWKEGYSSGVVTTCAVLYSTFQKAGLEKSNIFYTILKDYAKTQGGCVDLPAYIANMNATED